MTGRSLGEFSFRDPRASSWILSYELYPASLLHHLAHDLPDLGGDNKVSSIYSLFFLRLPVQLRFRIRQSHTLSACDLLRGRRKSRHLPGNIQHPFPRDRREMRSPLYVIALR